MNFRLRIEPKEFQDEGLGPRRFSFAVVDLDRSKSYPQNFVCLLPMRIDTREKAGSTFQKIFGDKSIEKAKELLARALKNEEDSEVKIEIERRLKLLEPRNAELVECSGCGHPSASELERQEGLECKDYAENAGLRDPAAENKNYKSMQRDYKLEWLFLGLINRVFSIFSLIAVSINCCRL